MKRLFRLIRALQSKKILLPFAALALIVVLLPAIVFVSMQRQDLRQRAAYGNDCTNVFNYNGYYGTCVSDNMVCTFEFGQADCPSNQKCVVNTYPYTCTTPRPSPTPTPSCATINGTCNSPGSQGGCCAGLTCSTVSPYKCITPARPSPTPSCGISGNSCNSPGSQGNCCSGLTCSTVSPYTCTSSRPSPRPSARVTPRPSPSPRSNPNCSYPGQSCNYTGVRSCTKNGLPGVQTCIYKVCGSGNVCSQSPQNCTTCVTYTPNLNTGCRESCIAAGNTPSECNGYPSCGTIHLSCTGKPNNSRCQLSNGLGYCQAGTCKHDNPVNSNCSNGNQCYYGLACINGKCRLVSQPTGAECVAGVQCLSRLCLGGQCRALNLGLGQTCAYDVQCNSGTCTQAGSGPKTCQAASYVGTFPAPPGHFCGTTSFATYYCTGPYQCRQGLCRKNGQLGAACTIGADCASGRCSTRQCTGINPDEVGLVPGFNLSSSPLTESQYYGMMLEKIRDCQDACSTNACRNQCETNVYNEVLYYSTLDSEQAVNECIMVERFYGDTRPISQLQTDCNTAVDSGGLAIATGAIGAFATFNNPSSWSSIGQAGRHAATQIGARASQGAASLQIWLSRIAQATSWYLSQNQNIPDRVARAPELLDLADCIVTAADELGDNINGVNWQNVSLSCAAVAQSGTQNGSVDKIVKFIVR